MRRMIALAGLAAVLAAGTAVGSTPAEARTRVFVGATFGGGFGPGYYDPGYYGPTYYAPPPPPPPVYYYEPAAPTYYEPPPPRYAAPRPAPVTDTGYCREYTTTISIAGRPREAFGQACMQPDGSWQRVTDPVPVPD